MYETPPDSESSEELENKSDMVLEDTKVEEEIKVLGDTREARTFLTEYEKFEVEQKKNPFLKHNTLASGLVVITDTTPAVIKQKRAQQMAQEQSTSNLREETPDPSSSEEESNFKHQSFSEVDNRQEPIKKALNQKIKDSFKFSK